MAEKLDNSELVSFKELLMANTIQVDAAVQLLIEKGFFTQDEFFIKLCRSNLNTKSMNQSDKIIPKTVDAVVEVIIADLTLAERVGTADLNENEFRVLKLTLGKLIQYKLDQLDVDVNKELMNDCLVMSGESLSEIDAVTVIIKEIWKRLRETHHTD